MIKAVIFDMDGLMFDTEKLWVENGTALAKAWDYDLPKELFIKAIGMKDDDIGGIFSNYLGFKFPFVNFKKAYNDLIENKLCTERIVEKKGLRELLVFLKNNKYKIAIASSNTRERINLYLNSAKIGCEFFDVIVSGDEVAHGKPSPEIFNKTCYYLKEKPDNVLILEDSVNGSLAAKKSHCHLIIVPDIINIPYKVEKLADYKTNSLMEVINILYEKNK